MQLWSHFRHWTRCTQLCKLQISNPTLQIGGCGAEHVTQTERKKHSVKRDQLSPVLHQCYKLWVTWKTPCMSSCISPVLQLRISDAIFSICILSSESERPNCWLPRYRFWRDSTAVFSWNEERTFSGKLSQSNCTRLCPDWNKFSKSYNTNINRDRQMTVVKEQIAACRKFECLRK